MATNLTQIADSHKRLRLVRQPPMTLAELINKRRGAIPDEIADAPDRLIAEMVGVRTATARRWRTGDHWPQPRHVARLRELAQFVAAAMRA